jgi:chromosome partitioning protein
MIVSFSIHKGGVGKTTSSINLACGLALAGHETLLIDCDPQGHDGAGVGAEITYEDKNMADVLGDPPVPLESIIRPTPIPHLSLAPANLRLAAVAESLFTKFRREERLKNSLAPLQNRFEWIIIDCPPALGALTANAIAAADVVIVPCQIGARSLDGLDDLLDLIHLLKGEDFHQWHILLTMVDPRSTLTWGVFERMLEPYKERVLHARISRTEALNQAQIAKKPIFSFDAKGRGAQDYEALTQELLALYPQDIPQIAVR